MPKIKKLSLGIIILLVLITSGIGASYIGNTTSAGIELIYSGRIFLEEEVSSTGLPLYVTIANKTVLVLTYYGDGSTILYAIKDNNVVDKKFFQDSKPLCMETIGLNQADIVLLHGSSVVEYIYDTSLNKLISGFSRTLPGGTIINGCIISSSKYYMYGTKVNVSEGFQNYIIVLGPAGNLITQKEWGTPYDDVLLGLTFDASSLYAVSLNASDGYNSTLYMIGSSDLQIKENITLPLIRPINIDNYKSKLVVVGILKDGKAGLYLIDNNNATLISFVESNLVFLTSVFIDENNLVLAGEMLNKSTMISDGIIVLESLRTEPNLTDKLIITGKNNITLTASTIQGSVVVIAGSQGRVPFVSFYNVKYLSPPTTTPPPTHTTGEEPKYNTAKIVIISGAIIIVGAGLLLVYFRRGRKTQR